MQHRHSCIAWYVCPHLQVLCSLRHHAYISSNVWVPAHVLQLLLVANYIATHMEITRLWQPCYNLNCKVVYSKVVAFCARCSQSSKVVTTLHDGCEVVVQILKTQFYNKATWRVTKLKLNLYENRTWNIRLYWLIHWVLLLCGAFSIKCFNNLNDNFNAQIWVSPTSGV